MRKIKLFLSLLMVMLLSVGNVWGDSYTITLKNGTGSSDSSTGIQGSTTISDFVAEGASYVSAVAGSGKVYQGASGYGLKFGNSSGGGSITLTLDASVKPTSIVVNASQYGASEGEGVFQSQKFDMTGGGGKGHFNDYIVEYDGNTEVTTISVGCSKRGYVKSITVNYSGSTPPADPYTVSFSTGNGNSAVAAKTEQTAGAGIELPAGPETIGCSADGWTFAGWKETSAVTEQTTTAPTLLAAGTNYKPSDDVTLYAVYKRTESGDVTDQNITETFETQEAGSTYNSTQNYEASASNANIAWTMYYGTVSTNDKIADSKSAQMRWYSSATSSIPYVLTTTSISGLQSVNFKARVSNTGVKMSLWYSTDGENWTISDVNQATFAAANTAYDFSATITGTVGTNYYIKIGEDGGTAPSSGNYKLIIDAVQFNYKAGASTTYYLSAPTCAAPTCEDLGTPVVTVTNKTYNSAKLTWVAVANAAKYVVKFNGEDHEVTNNYYDATGLTPSTQYTYQVKALAAANQDDYCDGEFTTEANFTTEEAPQVQLWLVEKQGETAKNGGTHALGVEFDIPASTLECSKVFRGWTTEAYKDYTHATDAPAVLMNKYTFESEDAVTLYAIYADETPGAATLTKLNGSSMPVAGDKIVIVGIDTNDDSKHALYQETSGSSYVKHWAFDNNVATVAADAKKYVTLEAANDGKFYLGDATNGYVYSSGSNNLSVDLTNKTAWTIAWDADASAFTFNQGRYLSCRSDLTGDNTYLYRLAGGTPAGIWKLDVYKYGTSASTYSNYAATCSNLLDNPTFSLDPVVAPVNDKYEEAINVVITNNAGEGTIYYTTNGENPTSASDEYTDPITLNTCGTKTIKAIVISATNHSEVVTATYEMAIPIPSVSAEDPYTEAEAVAVYNSGCYNNEDVYVTGTVQTAQFYSSNTYTITLTNGFQFYYFYESFDGENLVPFENDYIVAGDVLVAKGKLGKHNTTYQIANGYLVSRTPASKTPIDSDIDNPISVAAAIGYIDAAATYDLSEDEFVAGVVESIAECPQHEGTYDIIVLDATDNTKQMKFFGCDVKTFTGIKQYDEIIGKGKLDKYYSTYELNYPCEVVALTPYVAPAVSVTGVEVDATASVLVGKTVQLTATVTPDNATNKNVTWSVKAGGEDYAEVSATGLVTGKAEGEAIIVVTTEDGSFTDECTVTINPVPYWATVYTSNVAFVGGGSSYENNSKVVINSNEYDAQKVGASSKTGTVTVTVPAYTHTLHFHVFTWKNQTMTMGVASDDVTNLSAETIDVIGDDGGGASSPYTIEGNPVDHYQYITFDPISTEAQIVFSYSSGGDKRFIMYGINQVGGVLPELDHIVITGTATETEYEVGDVFVPAGLGVDAYYTLAGTPVAEPEHLVVDENWSGWSVDPAILTGETTSVIVTATYGEKQANKDVDITVNVPVTPEIVVNTNAIAFGKVNQNATVDPEGISVTLKSVAAATVTLAGDGAAAFSIDKDALSELNSTITVTPVTTAVGTFAATITISDDANAAEAKEIALSMTVEAVEDLSGTWVVAKSVAAGDRIIIGATYQGNTKTMGGQNTNNRAAVASTYEDLVLTPAAGTKTFLVVDAGDGMFALQALNGNYLTTATSGTGNHLLEAANYENNNAKWTITIDDVTGEASVVAAAGSKKDLQYNNSNDIFSCYSTNGQKPINIYKKGTPDYGSYQRTVTSGNFGTICLPKAGTISGATLFEIADYQNNIIYVDEILSGELEAGVPYIFQADANVTEIVVNYTSSTVEENAGHANGLYGFYNLSNENAQYDIPEDAGNYILYQNAYWLVKDRAAYIANYRAYIKLNDINNTGNQAPGRRRVAMAVNGEQTATGMESIQLSEISVQKVLINGQLFILRGEKMYDVKGQLVK